MPLDEELSMNVGMVIPDNDIMGIVYKNNRTVLIISLIVIIAAIIISVLVSSIISKPMKTLSTEMNNIKELAIDDGVIMTDSGIKEIDNMVESFQGMKQGLMNFKKYVPWLPSSYGTASGRKSAARSRPSPSCSPTSKTSRAFPKRPGRKSS